MDRIETLCLEHRRIAALLDHLEQMLDAPAAPPPLEFLMFRRTLSRTVFLHLKKEDWLVYPKLRASRNPEARAVAAQLGEELGSAEREFSGHSRRWTSLSIAADWQAYRADAAVMIGLIRKRMASEERRLYPLVASESAGTAAPAARGRPAGFAPLIPQPFPSRSAVPRET